MNKTILLLFLLINTFLQAQSIERELISTAGEIQTINGTAIVSWSIGEPIIDNYIMTNHIIQGFQQGEKSAPLPVNLITFEAKRLNPLVVHLNWAAIWTGNFQGFWLERRLENETVFTPIDFIEKQELDDVQNFFYADNNPHFDNSYYRLKMVEADESFKYSTIKVVKGTPLQHVIKAFPNPFIDHVQLEIIPDFRALPIHIEVELYQSNGLRVVQQSSFFSHSIRISNIDHLAKGWYILKLKVDEQPFKSLKLFKND